MKHRLYVIFTTTLAVPFIIFMAATNVLHPMFHMFEGGSIDAAIDYLTAVAAQIASSIQTKG